LFICKYSTWTIDTNTQSNSSSFCIIITSEHQSLNVVTNYSLFVNDTFFSSPSTKESIQHICWSFYHWTWHLCSRALKQSRWSAAGVVYIFCTWTFEHYLDSHCQVGTPVPTFAGIGFYFERGRSELYQLPFVTLLAR